MGAPMDGFFGRDGYNNTDRSEWKLGRCAWTCRAGACHFPGNKQGSNMGQKIAVLDDLRREVSKYVLVPREETVVAIDSPVLAQLRERKIVNSHLPIGWPVMPKGILNKLIAYAKKITRALLRWYINPIVDQQNRFNDSVVVAISGQSKAARETELAVTELESQVAGLLQELERLRWRQQELERRLEFGRNRLGQTEEGGE
jgi:hypothetical protein